MIRSLASAAVVCTLLQILVTVPSEADEPAATLRVMSFNIRYGTANDGDNRWEKRRDFLVETIVAWDLDLLGTQETLGFQRDYLAERLAGYEKLGVGREDGKENGEMMALYYKRERFERIQDGHFWLSETPESPGSMSWGTSLPRMATWVKLRDRKQTDGKPVLFVNTHFDHRSADARFESARLMRRHVPVLGEGCSIIVTGDFNCGESSPPYRAFFGPQMKEDSPFVDTYRAIHREPMSGEGTFSGFNPESRSGGRIDWIAVSRDWKIHSADIDHTSRDGRTPSDHFAVTAVLER